MKTVWRPSLSAECGEVNEATGRALANMEGRNAASSGKSPIVLSP